VPGPGQAQRKAPRRDWSHWTLNVHVPWNLGASRLSWLMHDARIPPSPLGAKSDRRRRTMTRQWHMVMGLLFLPLPGTSCQNWVIAIRTGSYTTAHDVPSERKTMD
jgi:hypothetical protein